MKNCMQTDAAAKNAANVKQRSGNRRYAFSLEPFCSLYHFHQDFLPFNKGFTAFSDNSTVMNENVFAFFLRNETVTFFFVEPFYGSFNLSPHSPLIFSRYKQLEQPRLQGDI